MFFERRRRNSFPFDKIGFFSRNKDVETSLRLRNERLKRNEALGKKIQEIKTRSNEQTLAKQNPTSIFTFWMNKYRRPFYIGLLTIFTGSIFFYKFVTSNERTR